MDAELEEIKQEVEIRKQQEIEVRNQQEVNMFKKPEMPLKPIDKKDELLHNMINQAVVAEVSQNPELKEEVLNTARTITATKMEVYKQNADTEHKEARYNNAKDACECYGSNEKTAPIWAINFMSWGYNVVLAIWILIGTFTFMPVIFMTKKISVGLKKTWIAILAALIIYLCITFVPVLIGLLTKR